jgi:hypothetical protein
MDVMDCHTEYSKAQLLFFQEETVIANPALFAG